MNYTLVTPQGRVYTFYIQATAECYQQAYGGTLFDSTVVNTEIVEVQTA